jgi:hypothetical protein
LDQSEGVTVIPADQLPMLRQQMGTMQQHAEASGSKQQLIGCKLITNDDGKQYYVLREEEAATLG